MAAMSRAPARLGRNGLEWSWRLLREPGRMGRRYLADTGIFTLQLAEVPAPRCLVPIVRLPGTQALVRA